MGLSMSPDDIQRALTLYVQQQTGAQRVELSAFSRLSGGAIQSNSALSVQCTGGNRPGKLDLVGRSDSPSKLAPSLTRGTASPSFLVDNTPGEKGTEPLWLVRQTAATVSVFSLQ